MGKGLEAELSWQASNSLRVLGNYSYQRNIEQATKADAGYAPHHDWRRYDFAHAGVDVAHPVDPAFDFTRGGKQMGDDA